MLDVYRTFYKLTGEPFRLSPDHRFSLGHPSYANAKAYLDYAILQGEGFVAITGAPGTGKTTLINDVLAGFKETDMQIAMITSTQLESRDLLHMVAHAFDVHPEDRSKANLVVELERFLNKQNYRGHRAILIVDEAQSLSATALEELRLLANLQRNHQLLLQIFLVGQRKLLDLIRAPGMDQLQQRLVAAAVLEPLDLDGVVDYVEHRLRLVAWRGDPSISEEALRLVHRYSGGIPRRINMICNRLFLYGGMQEKHELGGEDAKAVIEELQQEFLLPAESLRDQADVPQAAEQSDAGGKAAQRSLPRGEAFAERPSSPLGQRQPPRQARRRKETQARPQSSQNEATRPQAEPTKQAVAPTAVAPDRRSFSEPDKQPTGRGRRLADEPVRQQKNARRRGIAAAGLFLLIGSLFAGIFATDKHFQGMLRAVGLGDSGDTSNTTLKTGVHKAIEAHEGREKPGIAESQRLQAGSDAADVGRAEPPQDQVAAISVENPAANPTGPVAGGKDAIASARPTGATLDTSIGSTQRPGAAESRPLDDDPATASAPPPVPAMTSTEIEGADTGADAEAPAATVEAEYEKLRRVADERFSERRDLVATEVATATPAPKQPPTARTVVGKTVKQATEPESSGVDSAAAKPPAPSAPKSPKLTASAPKGSLPKVSQPKASIPKLSMAGASAPKVSVPKVSQPKAVDKSLSSSVSQPKPATPQPSAPKPSAPKQSQAKASQPKITVASATKPKRESKKSSRSLNQIKPILLEGQWSSQGKPASLLPSEITFCNSQGEDRIGCWSSPQDINTKYGPALYKVETTLKGFSKGSFKLSYRTLVKLLDADASARARERAASSEDGWRASEHSMQCQLTDPDSVLCRDKKGVTRNYQRQRPARGN